MNTVIKDRKKPTKSAGFTLVEIMVVLVIVALLAGMIVPNILDSADKARVQKVQADFAAIKTALSAYRLDNYTYPTTEQGLEALVDKPELPPEPRHWKNGGYLPELPLDPWERPYYYQSPGENGPFDIYTLGADGIAGGEEVNADIGNWREEEQ
ncbi:type II secretion system major pseudopilin GspG [Porticoccus sp. W117]|uniref:type II secretion system major pseudopilin GspG n=1 Tax=Porticoccus sp. W117 TaxID=3054777 RepID=UPI00259137B6|nr:type II secretion system major pseudopilin GspG [Porticoccus sp. W117]MDM3869761.1 type II secretion system major pseudopilin GspG [Porticoccus sp. W117]